MLSKQKGGFHKTLLYAPSTQVRMCCAAVIQLMMTENDEHSFGFGSNPESVLCALYM